LTGFFYDNNEVLIIKKGGKMSINQLNGPSKEDFPKILKEVFLICDTGISLSDDCPPIFFARPKIEMNVYPILLDYFDKNPLEFKEKPFSFFVGRKLLLREVRGYEGVLQLVDKRNNMLELKMKPNIEDILRHKKLVHIKRRITAKENK
jgi:hypothetical protein